MNDSLSVGLSKIKKLFSDEDKKKDIAKKSIVPLGALSLVGGLILSKKLRRKGPGWGKGEREKFIEDLGKRIRKHM